MEPFSIQERFAHVSEARGRFGTRVPWLTDPMSNEASQALGGLPNAGYLFDGEGRVIYASPWAHAQGMRAKLAELVGPVENPTTVASLDLPEIFPRSDPAQGVVPRVKLNELLAPIKIEPHPRRCALLRQAAGGGEQGLA